MSEPRPAPTPRRSSPPTAAADPGDGGEPLDAALETAPVTTRHGALPSVLLALGVAVGVGVAAVAIAFSIIAVPLYLLASLEPGSGVDRTLVRRGLFGVAMPIGLVVGIVVGVLVGTWYGRGGRLPGDRTPRYE